MNRLISILSAGIVASMPLQVALAAPPGTTSQGATQGKGWSHTKGPATTGQPGVECGEAGALNRPGNAASAPGSAFNPEGTAGSHYAGEQPQNSRNTASVSQYDTACAHQPPR
jgi:hypothetical protein